MEALFHTQNSVAFCFNYGCGGGGGGGFEGKGEGAILYSAAPLAPYSYGFKNDILLAFTKKSIFSLEHNLF